MNCDCGQEELPGERRKKSKAKNTSQSRSFPTNVPNRAFVVSPTAPQQFHGPRRGQANCSVRGPGTLTRHPPFHRARHGPAPPPHRAPTGIEGNRSMRFPQEPKPLGGGVGQHREAGMAAAVRPAIHQKRGRGFDHASWRSLKFPAWPDPFLPLDKRTESRK